MSFDLRSFNRQIMKAYREMQEFNEARLATDQRSTTRFNSTKPSNT